MTELQPSPPGYRVQDEAPGPPSCPPGSYKYASHGHGSEAANFKSATTYSQEGYGLKQNPPRPVAPNEYYRRSRNDGRRSSTENDHEGGKKAAAVAGYNDGHKRNTPSYKNDSGYVLLSSSLSARALLPSFSSASCLLASVLRGYADALLIRRSSEESSMEQFKLRTVIIGLRLG